MKRCIVLGGSGTVGQALCRELARQGAAVALSYHQGQQVARELEQSIGAHIAQLDLTDDHASEPCVQALCDQLGGVDALIHCAAIGSTCTPARFDRVDDVTFDGFDRLMAINVKSAFIASRALRDRFEGGGNIVLFGSVDGLKPVPSPAPYAVSKAALQGLTLSLSKAFGEKNIRVNLVTPGVLEEGASRTLPDHLREEYIKHCGLRRLGRVAEVTPLAAWMALENSYVTGQTLVVDGGL